VPAGKAARRRQRLLEVQRPIALERRRALVGRTLQVLVEGVCEETEHLLQGRHHGMAPDIDGRILINDGLAPAATLADVEITEAYADDLVGRIVGPEGTIGIRPAETFDWSPSPRPSPATGEGATSLPRGLV
jgi:tRNA A37 methylthiotransferase MiaB